MPQAFQLDFGKVPRWTWRYPNLLSLYARLIRRSAGTVREAWASIAWLTSTKWLCTTGESKLFALSALKSDRIIYKIVSAVIVSLLVRVERCRHCTYTIIWLRGHDYLLVWLRALIATLARSSQVTINIAYNITQKKKKRTKATASIKICETVMFSSPFGSGGGWGIINLDTTL